MKHKQLHINTIWKILGGVIILLLVTIIITVIFRYIKIRSVSSYESCIKSPLSNSIIIGEEMCITFLGKKYTKPLFIPEAFTSDDLKAMPEEDYYPYRMSMLQSITYMITYCTKQLYLQITRVINTIADHILTTLIYPPR